MMGLPIFWWISHEYGWKGLLAIFVYDQSRFFQHRAWHEESEYPLPPEEPEDSQPAIVEATLEAFSKSV